MLNWRLGLDLAELLLGLPMAQDRWLSRGQKLIERFIESFGGVDQFEMINLNGGLYAIGLRNKRSAVFFGHPLWREDQQYWVDEQALAYDHINEMGYGSVHISNLHSLESRPFETWSLLQ